MVSITYEILRKVQADERNSSALSALPPDFYASVRSMVRERKEKLARNFSLADAREFENTLKVLKDIYALREQKMLLRALAAAGGARDGSALSPEERWAFDEVVRVLEKGKEWFGVVLEGTEDELPVANGAHAPRENADEKRHHEKHPQKVKVRFLAPIQEFMGADGSKLGPFETGQEVELPSGEAEFMLRRKAAEKA